MNRITDTLDAAVLTIVQSALDNIISPDEAERRVRRAERLTLVERLRGMGLAPRRWPGWMRRHEG